MSPGQFIADADAAVLLARLRQFCFPGGIEAARGIRAVRVRERGELRSAPNARWMPFTAEMEIQAARSGFRWDARFGGGVRWLGVTDAYENGRGMLALRVGGIPVKKMTGPEFDQGELQRCLASLALCTPMLLNHPSLVFAAAAPGLLRLRDGADPTGAWVDLEIGEQGCPLGGRARRPRTLGKQAVETPWRVAAGEFRECEGLRVPGRTEASWDAAEGAFPYYKSEFISFVAVR